MKKRKAALVAVVISILFLSTAAWFVQKRIPENSVPIESITIGGNREEASLLITLAENRGIFRRNGLNVILKEYESGYKALGQLVQGEVDIAAAADYPFVINSFDHKSLRIVASIATMDTNEIVARADKGITRPSDLRGKRIAVLTGTTLEFYLKRFLLFHHISPEEVTMVPLPASQLVNAISRGQVDAAIGWDLYIYEMKKELGDNAVNWPLQSGQDYYWLLVSEKEKIDARPKVIEKFIRSMVEAEDFIKESEEEAKAFLTNSRNREPRYIEYLWKRIEYTTSLPQGLIIALEDQAGDRLEAMPGENMALPNYLELIYQDGLKAVKPKGVTIFQ